MNYLSWMFYAAELFEGLKMASILALAFTVTIAMILAIIGLVEENPEYWGWIKKLRTPLLLSLLVAVAIPSKQTVYMILASEMAETALESEDGQKLRELVSREIDRMLEESE